MKKLAYAAWIAILCITPLVAAGTAGAGQGQTGTTLGADEVSGAGRCQAGYRDPQCLGRVVAAGRDNFQCRDAVPRADCWDCCWRDYNDCISIGADSKYCVHMRDDICRAACDAK